MKQALVRLAIYIAIITTLDAMFTGFDSYGGPLPNSATAGKIGYYAAFYGLGYGFWILILESVYRAARYMNRPKLIECQPNTTLDTQGLTSVYVPPGHENCPECRQPIDAIPDKMLKSLEENRKLLETRPLPKP